MNEEIIREIDRRNISRLCHFTNFTAALKILRSEKGILASEFIDRDVYLPNDLERYDGKSDFVCCSLEYPNTWYLNRIKNLDPLFNEWIILFIEPKLAALETSKFCPVNAATNKGAYITDGVEGFYSLFQQEIPIGRRLRRSPNMLDACPTDGQAEVLIFKNISRDDIIGLGVENLDTAKRVSTALTVLKKSCDITDKPIFVAPDLFVNTWNPTIRSGEKPKEILYNCL